MAGTYGPSATATRPPPGRPFSGPGRRVATTMAAINKPTASATTRPVPARRLTGSGPPTRGPIFEGEGRLDGAGVGSSSGSSGEEFATATLAPRPAGRASG